MRSDMVDAWVSGDMMLNLGQFDTQTSKFDLCIFASDEMDSAVGVEPSEIARFVETTKFGSRAECVFGPGWIFDEDLRSLLGVVEIGTSRS
jgi:hypothetical protein